MILDEITDKNVWESFISQNSPASLFQSWNWGETQRNIKYKKSSANWRIKNKIWRLGIYKNNQLVGIAQVQKVEAIRGRFLHIRHGPIFSSWKSEYLEFLFENLIDLAKKERTWFIRISPLKKDITKTKEILSPIGFHDAPIAQLDGEICWVLDLTQDEEQILLNMRKTTRYLIRQAQKLEVKIVKSSKLNDIKEFLSLYEVTAARQHFVKHQGIKEEFDQFKKDKQILLFKGYFGNKLLAAAIIVFYNHQAVYHHSASIEQKIPVNYLMQWEIIRQAKKRGKKIYNMWGVARWDNLRHPWTGLTLFKKGFGGQQVEYLHTQDLPLSAYYYYTYMIEFLRKIWKGY